MSLSCHERRQLAAVERALSRDPVLSAVAGLFAQPPAGPRAPTTKTYRRWEPGLLIGIVLLGVATTVVGAALVVPALQVVGLTALAGGALAFAGTAIRRGTRARDATPALASQTRERG